MVTDLNLSKINPLYLIAGLAVIAAVIYVKKNGVQGVTYNLASGLGGAAVDAVNGVVSGTVTSIGKVVGIPTTSQTQCQADMRAGNKWDASFSCDAGTYISWLAHGAPAV